MKSIMKIALKKLLTRERQYWISPKKIKDKYLLKGTINDGI